MNQDQRNRTFGQQPDLARAFAGLADAGSCKQLGEMRFQHRLVATCDDAGGMSGEVGKLNDEAGET